MKTHLQQVEAPLELSTASEESPPPPLLPLPLLLLLLLPLLLCLPAESPVHRVFLKVGGKS